MYVCGVCARVHVRLCVLTILFLLLSRADQNQAKNGNRGILRKQKVLQFISQFLNWGHQ